MAQKIEANAHTFNEIFGALCVYYIPVFQRRYVWGAKEIDELMDDLQEIDLGVERDRHFLGPVIVSERKAGGAARRTESWVIDGQQRLTTVYLTLAALASASKKRQEFFEDVCTYLFHKGKGPDKKLKPILINDFRDHPQMRKVFDDLGLEEPVEFSTYQSEDDGPLIKAYRRIKKRFKDDIKKRLEQWQADNPAAEDAQRKEAEEQISKDYCENLFTVLLERALVVYIELTKEEDAKQIFDTLNSAGQPLANIDLIKNEVLGMRVEDDLQFSLAQQLYVSHWEPLEKRMGDEKLKLFDGYLFPYALTHNPRVKKNALVNELCSLWDGPPRLNSISIIASLSEHVPVYLAIVSSNKSDVEALGDADLVHRYYRFRRMGGALPNSTYSFIFSLHSAYIRGALSKDHYLACLDLTESFLVRRALDGIEPTGLHAVFKLMWEKTSGDPEKFVAAVSASKTVKVPTDEELRSAIKLKPLYGRSLANYILFEYEKSFTDGDQLPEDYDLKTRLTLDHVMPQSPASFDDWMMSREEHAKVKDTWANLVPLTPEANSQKGNVGWVLAKDFYQRYSLFKSTRHFGASYASWSLADVEARSTSLADWAISRWVF